MVGAFRTKSRLRRAGKSATRTSGPRYCGALSTKDFVSQQSDLVLNTFWDSQLVNTDQRVSDGLGLRWKRSRAAALTQTAVVATRLGFRPARRCRNPSNVCVRQSDYSLSVVVSTSRRSRRSLRKAAKHRETVRLNCPHQQVRI